MNEEIRNEMVEVEDSYNEEIELDEACASSKIPMVLAIGLIGGAMGAAYLCKDKIGKKLEERRIKKLEKKGYIVCKELPIEEEEYEEFEEEATEE